MTVAHSVPAEVWGKVFELSCNDGGQTGRSLALVSHYIHAVSKPYQYQSVVLVGEQSIDRFAKLLSDNPGRRRVKSLFLSTFTPDQDIVKFICKGPLEAQHERYGPRWVPRQPADATSSRSPSSASATTSSSAKVKTNHAILSDIYKILDFIAPTVHTLHILMDFYREEIFFSTFFPVLEELSIQGPFHDHEDCNDDFCDTLYPRIPSLRRLYLTDVFTCIKDRTYLAIKHYAPSLTDLRIQCADGYIESSVTFLKQLRGEEEESFGYLDQGWQDYTDYSWYGEGKEAEKDQQEKKDEDEQNKEPQFPETLKRIFLHPGPAQPRGRCGALYMIRWAAIRELEKCASQDPRIKLFEESPWVWPYSREFGFLEGKRRWLESITGGPGFWTGA